MKNHMQDWQAFGDISNLILSGTTTVVEKWTFPSKSTRLKDEQNWT